MKRLIAVAALIAVSVSVYAKGIKAGDLVGKWTYEKDQSVIYTLEANNKMTDSSKPAATVKWNLIDDNMLILTYKENGAAAIKTFKVKKLKLKSMEIKLLFIYDAKEDRIVEPEKGQKSFKFIKK